ncbi:hypothetical protein [Jeotgalibacillus proteolyticus]|uniref:Transcriptional regulator n=1 Tax=Jeotgalibacillus proteolyticus TaxID=2082395 RepID=A0A2S5GBH4_9BACL|nr:hypothetical protein [Jeotgalibacillus proteolyticus]PPA70308.1 hypothetical protein C4B60_12070 [Jeotgalibacillus proteolyticus]
MKIRLGAVGPEDSIEKIEREAAQFEDLIIIPFSYETTEETKEIIQENKSKVDFWLFSGQAPYYYAQSLGLIQEHEAGYPPLYGSSLLGELLNAQYKHGAIIPSISVDTISTDEMDSFRRMVPLDELNVYALPYDGYLPSEEIVRFHEKLYFENKISAAFTGIRSVYLELKKRGVPCYRVMATELAIQLTIKYIREQLHSSYYRKSQIAIVGIERILNPAQSEEDYYSYKMKHLDLDMKRLILHYAERIKGSYVQIGDGLFSIYTTLGELELQTFEPLFELQNQSLLQTKLPLRAVVGYGRTAMEAEQNVRQAFLESKKTKGQVVFCVNEDKVVHQIIENEKALTYNQRQWGEEWLAKFKAARISPSIVSKLQSISGYYNKQMVTSKDIATWLNSTERNARRVLTALEEMGLAQVSGEEQPGQRGRPRRFYTLLF